MQTLVIKFVIKSKNFKQECDYCIIYIFLIRS